MSGWFLGRDAVDGDVYFDAPAVHLSSGPERVVRDQPKADAVRRPVGFVQTPRHRRHVPADSPSLARFPGAHAFNCITTVEATDPPRVTCSCGIYRRHEARP